MLTKETALQINNFVAQRPRTIQEIAELIGANWRTAESYVNKISEEQGTLSTRTFRGGTRGALKIVYWNLLNKNQSTFQETLFNKIISSKSFSPFDIYQYIDEAKRECFIEEQENNLNIKQDLIGTISSAETQVLIFSGNLSWAEAFQSKQPLIGAFEKLLAKKVPIKIVTNVDLNSKNNVNKVLELNIKYGQELIEVRHCQQPLRGFVIDNRLLRMKEKYFLNDKLSHTYLFYSITDEEWINWAQKVFWHFFSSSILAQKRLESLDTIKKM